MIFFLQCQKGELSREDATDKIISHALKSKRQLLKQDDDDVVQGAAGGEDTQREESGNEEFLIPVMYGHLKIERKI